MIDRSSRTLLAVIYAIALLICLFFFLFVHNPWVLWPVVSVIVWFCVWQAFFFHVPERVYAGDENKVTAVSDGKVVICEKVLETETLGRECFQISVYMNFFDIHANFWPVSGTVTGLKYIPGKHFLAFNPKSSLDNEHTCVVVNTGSFEVLFKQIAGGFARRIAINASHGKEVEAGKQCGIIKFGSRIDYLLPVDSDIKVELGQDVRACETIMAELPKRA